MEYSIQALAKLAGVSSRTLRYYDELGLLRPLRLSESGYRMYGPDEVDRLQQILFYRALELPLERIGKLLGDPGFDARAALREHRAGLLEKRAQLDRLIATVEKTIAANERSIPMQDHEKFEGFKQALVDDNEARYGAEIREQYGDAEVDGANRRLLDLSPTEYNEMERLEAEVLAVLDEAFASRVPYSERGRELVALHKRWLCLHWSDYTPQKHAHLAEMYVGDERFAAYYDRGVPGRAQFLRDAIVHWTARE